MVASVLLREPGENDHAITTDEIKQILADEGVVFGIDEGAIERIVANHEYNTPRMVAAGTKPKRGEAARFEYNFDTSDDRKPKENDSGHIDYKDIDFIQNVGEGETLVTKIPPGQGIPGMSVLGKELAGPEGRDIPFKNGANTKISDDGLQLLAAANGAIQFIHSKVSVSDVITISGDVDHNVGNIRAKGSVRVSGHVRAGFKIEVDGDLEVNGNVEDADLDVKGNIYVKGGFFGSGKGVMKAGGDITLKFAEGQKISAGNEIHVGGEIINCQAVAKEKILMKGRKGRIVGGDVKAGKEIRSSVLGSEAGSLTSLTVAFDPETMAKLREIDEELKRLNDDGERVKEALYALLRLQMDGKLTSDKQTAMVKLKAFQKELPDNIAEMEKQKEQVVKQLEKYKDSQIIAEDTLHSGVKAQFGIVYREFTDDKKRCRLTVDGNKVMISEFKSD